MGQSGDIEKAGAGGRVVFGAGLGGVPAEFTAFGEDANLQDRAQKLDEGLAILDLLWSGEPTTFHAPFDVALSGISLPEDQAMVNEYADAGVTWWLESLRGMRGSIEDLLQCVKAGPPV